MIDLDYVTVRMSNNAEAIRRLAQGTTAVQARWKPDPKSWSILEVINHLYDEEREDFRFRLDLILHHPQQTWPGNDPEGWVTERGYNQRDFETSLHNFSQERQASITWLKSLSAPNWQHVHDHPSIGPISAEDMLFSWLAHDLLHTRQLVELQWAYLAQQVRSIALDYTGGW
jgi:hypothetical protein